VFEGETLLHRAARIAREVAPTIVVLRGADMRSAVADLDVTVVENPEAGEGMASSIRRAVAATDGDLLLTLCDQPHITAAHLRSLVAVGSPIAATGYSGTAGVPAFFAAKFRDELLALRGDVGAKKVIAAHLDEVVTIPFEAASIDVDTDPAVSL
jgi:CTP:molybdopterin cytidylyltransferase MocA